jgi:cytochrome c oxidase subunit 2
MRIEAYERLFIWLSVALLVVFLGAVFYAAVLHDIQVPDVAGRVDPATLQETPPFDDPGVQEVGPNRYQVNMVARMWSFNPNEIVVPVGSEVSFAVATPDLIHGFRVEGTNINIMVMPGWISAVSHTFDTPGEYRFVCHEYCGVGHQGMFGTIIVEDRAAARPGASGPGGES